MPANIEISKIEKEQACDLDISDTDSVDIELNVEELDRIGDPRTPALLRFRDKVVFCLGVINIVCLAFFLHGLPYVMPWYYLVKAPILIGLRVYTFFQHKFQYFLIDFCYWANVLVIIYLIFLPENKRFYPC